MSHHRDKYASNYRDHSHIRIKKKKKKKKSENSIYVLLFFFSISLILYFNSEKVVNFVENLKKNSDNITLSNSAGYMHPMKNGKINKEDEDDSIKTLSITNSDDIRTNLLLDSFNIKKFEDDTYKLKFFDNDLINKIEIVKNSNFIYDAINYLFKEIKGKNLYPANKKDKLILRNEKEIINATSKLKRLIIIKLLKCLLVLVLLYIIFRLISSLLKKVINFIFVLIIKIIKFCCCGGL
ncbi:conserved Plasmodium protein, unknown function [Plasmodium relictum]|uniref:Uncharacterized protein n=1 Tax=Plasmodium relictum TaxID=85471 RepID=A0A1J1H4N6_PLARL|nr:conserved Plasmodium protein, unknown function [Plasmodium relictum]CRG99714.1 conserved Plasmodium protein, unknown function [Plasmodium relictum]